MERPHAVPALVLAASCALGTKLPRPADMTGFLDDYSRLRPGP